MKDLFAPLRSLQFVDRNLLKPNDYNPNKVLKENLDLLVRSIKVNGWTMPIVARPDYTIIDGFHRWTVAERPELRDDLGGLVPVVFVRHDDPSEDMYGTVTHNRARGTHLLEPMEKIVERLISSGKSIDEIARELGMKKEEVYRLSGMKRDDFLRLMATNTEYAKAFVSRSIEARGR